MSDTDEVIKQDETIQKTYWITLFLQKLMVAYVDKKLSEFYGT
jgi:hypothetical protein